jgi:hypothetical protein
MGMKKYLLIDICRSDIPQRLIGLLCVKFLRPRRAAEEKRTTEDIGHVKKKFSVVLKKLCGSPWPFFTPLVTLLFPGWNGCLET